MRRLTIFTGLLASILFICQPIAAEMGDLFELLDRNEFIFREELQPGMEGYALTVVDGITIEKIPLRIKGVIKDRGFNGRDMILYEVWGDIIDKTHGVAGGMSGSPIYVDGRLAGAISGHWLHTNQRVGIGTPIEYMLENLQREEGYIDSYDDPLPYGEPFFSDDSPPDRAIAFARDEKEAGALQEKLGTDAMVFVKAAIPIVVGGLDPGLLDMMRDDIEAGFGGEVLDIPVRLPMNVEIPETLEPGSTLATIWSRGDIMYGGYGTVTYITPDNRVLGFGHSMGRGGRTEVPMAYGYIYGLRPGLRKSNKYGGPTQLCGVITQDRGGAISGYYGVEPRMVPVYVNITSGGYGKRDYVSEVAGSRFYFPIVAPAVAKACISRGIPKSTGGLLSVDWRIEFENGERISRHDVYSGLSPVERFGDDLASAASQAVENRFERLIPAKVYIDATYSVADSHMRIIDAELVDVDNGLRFDIDRNYAVLVDENGDELVRTRFRSRFQPDKPITKNGDYIFNPGDPVFIHVRTMIKRGEESDYLFRLSIPESEPGKKGAIQIRGGANLVPGPGIIGPKAADKVQDERNNMVYFPRFTDSVDDILYEIERPYPANELVVEAIFENIKDAATREEALKLYDSETEESNVPVIGIVRIPFKLAEEPETEKNGA